MSTTKPGVRLERDSMGTLEVPADALYGASTMRAVLNFPISDLRFPRAFIRALGLVKLEQNSSGTSRDSNISYAAGLQAGLLQDISQRVSVEGGYRYLRTNATVDVAPHGQGSLGKADLHSSGQWYLSANYGF